MIRVLSQISFDPFINSDSFNWPCVIFILHQVFKVLVYKVSNMIVERPVLSVFSIHLILMVVSWSLILFGQELICSFSSSDSLHGYFLVNNIFRLLYKPRSQVLCIINELMFIERILSFNLIRRLLLQQPRKRIDWFQPLLLRRHLVHLVRYLHYFFVLAGKHLVCACFLPFFELGFYLWAQVYFLVWPCIWGRLLQVVIYLSCF